RRRCSDRFGGFLARSITAIGRQCEMVLETAVNGRADALVTFNLRDFAPAASRFGIELLLR
ncbi:MAG TPA: hypothetical protein VGH29_11780, partial [Candidatus Binataceae bacterium]